MDEKEIESVIRKARNEKDKFFQFAPQSPIPYDKRGTFQGLNYYPVDLSFRFKLQLYEHENKEKITVEDTKGGTREFLKWGEFRFKIEEQELTLQAYKSDPREDQLWVPFKDETNGIETYGAGRYMDLDEETHNTKDDKWILDFNIAYNPFCAYSYNYVCPYIHRDNWLSVKIKAGERNYNIK
ncbi:MAG: DUF1684 domain-containing protein [Promethearchaeota archaeon]